MLRIIYYQQNTLDKTARYIRFFLVTMILTTIVVAVDDCSIFAWGNMPQKVNQQKNWYKK